MTENGRVIYVTGASRGIGRATAYRLAEENDVVVINHFDRESSFAEETKETLESKGVEAVIQYFDVSNQASVKENVGRIINKYDRIDVLVNNAGITRDALLVRMKEDAWDMVLNINLKAVFLCSQTVAKAMMKKRSGRIISVASVSGIMGNAGQANYSASKAGVIGLTKTMARELAPRNITVNAVAPGFIETDMTAALPEKVIEEFQKLIPLGRAGQAADVAEAIAFFASDAAAYITGQVINVDGGMYM